MTRTAFWLTALTFMNLTAVSQTSSQIDNLVHTPGYKTGVWGELGDINVFGSGKQDVILLPGWGFDGTVFKNFIERHNKDFRMWVVTFPGFGGSGAPPMPKEQESYGDLYWTRGIMNGVVNLIRKEKLSKPIVISYFVYSNIIAMGLAMDYPDLVSKVIVISGMARYTGQYPSLEPRTLKDRVQYIDELLSKRWFKTVSKETWDKGNFSPATFTMDTTAAKRHWNMMSSVPIPVMVRYLCEMYSTDVSLEYGRLTVPTLVVVPAFTNDFLFKPENAYIPAYFHHCWIGALPGSKTLQMITLSDTHAFIMDDQPDKLDKVIDEFLKDQWKPFPAIR